MCAFTPTFVHKHFLLINNFDFFFLNYKSLFSLIVLSTHGLSDKKLDHLTKST